MKAFGRWMAAVLAAASFAGVAVAADGDDALQVPSAVREPAFLVVLAQELYWWYLDEGSLEMRRGGGFNFDLRRLAPEMDEGDDSEWAEIRIPAFALGVVVKRPDYRIEELGEEVRGTRFRMVSVYRLEHGRAPTDGLPGGPWQRVSLGAGETLQRVHERLRELRFPDPELTDRLRRACRRQMELDPDGRESGEQVIHVAPLSDVANEVWVYLENECWLMQFSTDREIEDPDGWTWEDLRVRTWDLRADTVSALGEMPGSNLAMTMDQAGRALYNCVVLGKRLVVVNPPDPAAPPLVLEHVWRD